MSSNSVPSPSVARTGLKAGAAFAGAVAKSIALAVVLGGGAFFFYLSRLDGPGMPGARAGGAGAVLALIASPSLLIAVLLLFFIPLYVTIGVAQGRAKAMTVVVDAHGETIAQRLGNAIAARVESMPRMHGAMQRTTDWLSVDQLCSQVAPVLDQGRTVRAVIAWVLKRLPLSDMLTEWQQARAASPGPVPVQGVQAPEDSALRELLERRITGTLGDMATPSRTPLYIALAVHAALLGAGVWLTA